MPGKRAGMALAAVAAAAATLLLLALFWRVVPAPQVTFVSLKGEKITTAGLGGRVVLVNFWATDCPICVKEMPDMETAPVAPVVALARFGRWDEVLGHPAPPREWLYTRGVWHYARGLAFNAKGRADDARRELASLEGAMLEVVATRLIDGAFIRRTYRFPAPSEGTRADATTFRP